MKLQSLGYIGVNATDLDAWRKFATELLALQVVNDTPQSLGLRMDDKFQRFVIEKSEVDGSAYFGWELEGAAELNQALAELRGAGITPTPATDQELERRGVAAMYHFRDPGSYRVELFHHLRDADGPFTPSRPISGFRTGKLGMGHAVVRCTDVDRVGRFYCDVLGFKPTDYAKRPYPLLFMHINPRHHSFGLVNSDRAELHHVMIEVLALDDVGQAYDIALEHDGTVGTTLGRHTNDYVTSFYAWTPSKFLIEYGWGGRSVDDATWEIKELTYGFSMWGHRRSWMPELRQVEYELLSKAAADGIKAPLQVSPGSFELFEMEQTARHKRTA